jgi:hypothetical protein
MLTSNKAETSPDLALRSLITRFRKQPKTHRFHKYPEGDLLSHVDQNCSCYLSCLLAVIRTWYNQGKPHTDDNQHDFRECCQALDWIVKNVFHEPPLLDGHKTEQQRIASPNLTWFRSVALEVEKAGKLNEGLKPSDIAELCDEVSLSIPRCPADADEKSRNITVGKILRALYEEETVLEVGGFLIYRESSVETNAATRKTYTVYRHLFERKQD